MGSVLWYCICICHWWCSHDDMHLSLQDGQTALMKASVAGQVQCMKMLLDEGAEVNLQDKVSDVIIHCVHAACTQSPL